MNETETKDRTSRSSGAGESANRRALDRRRIAGQSIILAIMVLFLLMFLGGIFIAVLRRNMARTERHGEALNAQQLSEAGLEFADGQLTHGVQGADWRPEPEFPTAAQQSGCFDDAPNPRVITEQDAQDPDFRWIRPWAPTESGKTFEFPDTRAEPQIIGGERIYPRITIRERGPSGGFSRVTYGGGRFLVRVTYNPDNNQCVGPVFPDVDAERLRRATCPGQPIGSSPLSRFLMIESIGREGIVDPDDPTTYVQQSLRRMLVAFKPIALLDYARFITDKDRTGEAFTLGASKFPLLNGMNPATHQDAQNEGVPGQVYSSDVPAPAADELLSRHVHTLNTIYGPVRSNGGLRINGEPMIVLNQDPQPRGTFQAVPGRGDRLEIAGNLERTGTDSDLAIRGSYTDPTNPGNAVNVNRTEIWNNTNPSAPPGLGQPGLDRLVAQNVQRIEAPDLTVIDPQSRMPRYKQLTLGSTPLQPGLSKNQSDVATKNGLGAGIYIDNTGEKQQRFGYNIQEDWLNPAGSEHWDGHVYNPPGALIQLIDGPITVTGGNVLEGKLVTAPITFQRGLIRITRSDRRWRTPLTTNPDDRDGEDTGVTTQYFQYPLFPGEQPEHAQFPPTFSNGVIYAEGNVRVWGKLPQDRTNACFPGGVAGQRLTIVSNATAYIEGSILKGEPTGPNQPRRSGVALMAREHVAVNATSNFMVQEYNSGSWARQDGENQWAIALNHPPDSYALNSLNAVDAETYPLDGVSAWLTPPPAEEGADLPPGATASKQSLYTQARGASGPEGASVELQVNTRGLLTDLFHPWWQRGTQRTYAHLLTSETWNYEATPLHPYLNANGRLWYPTSEAANFFRFAIIGNQSAYIAKTAVAPLDVRVEAALFAMNGSFFVIPGRPFNVDGADTRSAFREDLADEGPGEVRRHGSMDLYLRSLKSRLQAAGMVGANENIQDNYPYPFADEPLDIKLLILGSVTENRPAPVKAQEAWAQLWGWTPLFKSVAGAWNAHGGDGLSFQFDPVLKDTTALRTDRYGRPLPLMPRLPTSPDMIYAGEAQ